MKKKKPKLGADFDAILQKVWGLSAQWQVLRQLFADQAAVDLWARTARYPGWLIQKALLDQTVLGITRLCDSSDMGKSKSKGAAKKIDENLSLARLIQNLPKPVPTRLKNMVAELAKQSAPLRKHRNKRIAHTDYKVHREQAEALPPLTIRQIEACLDCIYRLLASIGSRYENRTLKFDDVSLATNGQTLLAYLRNGKRFFELQKDAWLGEKTSEEIIAALKER